MLKIFEQIFGPGTKSARSYQDDLIRRATERAVDATDARIRILPAYDKKMRAAVVHAIDSVVQLVDALSAPVPMSTAQWSAQPLVGTLFASPDSLLRSLACDCAYQDFSAQHDATAATALLLTTYSQKQTFGYDLVGDRTVADVPLTVVSFDEHRLLGVATCETETRRQLQLRAFDYVLTLALAEITVIREQRQDLQAHKRLLQAKLDIVRRSSGNLVRETPQTGRAELQQKMDRIEAELKEMGADDTVLQRNLASVVATLEHAERYLWLEKQIIYVDHLHYLRGAGHDQAIEFPLQLLRDAQSHALAAQLVEIPAQMPSG